MKQPKMKIELVFRIGEKVVLIESDNGWSSLPISSAKTKKTAYKRAAAKLRKLADEAERLAEES